MWTGEKQRGFDRVRRVRLRKDAGRVGSEITLWSDRKLEGHRRGIRYKSQTLRDRED